MLAILVTEMKCRLATVAKHCFEWVLSTNSSRLRGLNWLVNWLACHLQITLSAHFRKQPTSDPCSRETFQLPVSVLPSTFCISIHFLVHMPRIRIWLWYKPEMRAISWAEAATFGFLTDQSETGSWWTSCTFLKKTKTRWNVHTNVSQSHDSAYTTLLYF